MSWSRPITTACPWCSATWNGGLTSTPRSMTSTRSDPSVSPCARSIRRSIRSRKRTSTRSSAPPEPLRCAAVYPGAAVPPVESRNCSPRNRKHGRPRDASENHSPMDGSSEGQATDGRSGHGLRQKGRRAEQVSAQQPRAVRQNHGMAVVARRQVVTGPPGRSDSSDLYQNSQTLNSWAPPSARERGADIPLYLRTFLPMDVSVGRTQHESTSPQAGSLHKAAASSGLSSSPELSCSRDRGSFRRPAHRRHHPGYCGLAVRLVVHEFWRKHPPQLIFG